ncbi:ABC transporter ATP-binding protein [Salinibacterium sp. NSLL150]|uniref:ABC transporter ATP-binding protein n=1 Tax=unclassified Salinibacterium TaxID=2632331 RepID=UPI0018CFE551|nr:MULTISPECIES: ABC transporter ATP-binding protein [unclassified Salinibacterium]MBH0097524.1 ABC transporter ATP-binding protein [Salinibacterium sp. NSLL35]MBH0100279.1 ABC transporter ATP-binding protein [Salinibacterium sp. NSLL150]MBH0103038.1 ABC transporter ATP-binding protein [Salinibacterium sp. NSLL16]MBH0105799.1 ABC transporter ATP-binding protein [Salinibacterium sp. NSLL17]MBH0110422.1 ABC transporter ATP-binding protein [Salinibacterium sp. NG22]
MTASHSRRGQVFASGIGLDYNGNVALDNASVEVHAGEFFTLLGPSGSGKTTLLRIIAGLLEPQRGTISIDDADVTDVDTQHRDIGFVFQNYALFPHLTVAENIEFGLKVRKVKSVARAARLAEMIELVALGGLGDRYPAQLSGGQQQRVALGRALAQRPRVLLLDEPLGALDRALRQDLGAEIRRIQREAQTTAVYVTHDQDEAFILSDRMGVMRDGKVSQIGTPEELYRAPKDLFVARFLGKTNLFEAEVLSESSEGAVVRIGDHQVTARPGVPGGSSSVYCSVRPEQIVLSGDVVPEGHHKLTTGVVTDSRFLGQRQSVRIATDSMECSADLDPYGQIPAVGERVTLSVRIGESALVPRETA